VLLGRRAFLRHAPFLLVVRVFHRTLHVSSRVWS
jgi:hypothetical protein